MYYPKVPAIFEEEKLQSQMKQSVIQDSKSDLEENSYLEMLEVNGNQVE